MDKTIMQKFYDIARSNGVNYAYVDYIEKMSLHSMAIDAEALARQILEAAMIKRNAAMRKRADAIKINCNSVADQMNKLKDFARVYGVMTDYTFYLESIVLTPRQFDINDALELLFSSAIAMYDMRLRRKIDKLTGVTIIGGYHDAV